METFRNFMSKKGVNEMTRAEGEEWIRRFEGGNSEDKFRPSSNLSIMLRLMLHSHLRPFEIYDLTVGYYKLGYITKGLTFKIYSINDEDDEIIKNHIKKYNLGPNDKLITVSAKALRAKFQNMVSVYHTGENRPEMVDLYFAGIGKENKPMKRPKKEQEK